MSKKILVILLVFILIVAVLISFFLLRNGEGDADSKEDGGKIDTYQEQATEEELQNKIESAIREKLFESAS